MITSNRFLRLVICIAVVALVAAVGSYFTAPAIPAWYANLAKPPYAPPNWLFGPVWTLLYLMMGIAAFLVWDRGLERRNVRFALVVFAIQLALNSLWSAIFFGLRFPLGAFIEVIILWLAILATIMLFSRISRPAAWLLVPYIFWVSFAAFLNFGIWQANADKSAGAESVSAQAPFMTIL